LKCRFCGVAFDARLATQVEQQIPHMLAAEVESKANKALTMGILSFIICAPILAPMAISNGRVALNTLKEYPAYASQTSAHGRARAGVVLGWLGLAVFVLGFLVRLGA
jgi:hypothetical protein